jgi:hypothetical protein
VKSDVCLEEIQVKKSQLLSFAFFGAILCLLLFAGCGSSDNGFVATQTNPVVPQPDPDPDPDPIPPDAPVANADTFVALGNGTLNQSAANGVLANDIVNQATLPPFQGNTSAGGTLNLAADGSFTYTPPTGFLGTDRFEYTLTNVTGSSTASVVIVVSKSALFVNTTAASNGDGSQADPFDNINDAFNAAIAGDTVFVFAPSTIGPLTVPDGINLIGQGAGLVVAQTIVDPGTAPTLVGPVTANSNVVIAGFDVAGSGSQGIVANGRSNVTILSNQFQNNNNEHIRFSSPGGGIFVENNTFQDPSAGENGIEVFYSGGNRNVVVNIDNNNFNSSGSSSLGRAISILTPGVNSHIYNIRGNTFTGTNNSNSFSEAIYFESSGASVSEVTVTDNTITRAEDYGIRFFVRGSGEVHADVFTNNVSESGQSNLFVRGEGGGTGSYLNIFGNTISASSDDGFRIENTGGIMLRYIVSGNTFSNNADDAINFTKIGGNNINVLLQANNFTGNGGDGVEGSSMNGGTGIVTMRDNTFSGSAEQDLEYAGSFGGQMCFDITGNSFNANVAFNESNGSTINVERLSQGLDTVNTFVSGTVTTSGTVTPVSAGFCTSP